MQEVNGDIWSYAKEKDAVICITTNGIVNLANRLIMGKGIALQAAYGRPDLPIVLGRHVMKNGNVPKLVEYNDVGPVIYDYNKGAKLLSFPTKNHWRDDSDLTLIEQSAIIGQRIADARPELTFYLPRPGCGNGNLRWEDVRVVIEPILSDSFIIVDKET